MTAEVFQYGHASVEWPDLVLVPDGQYELAYIGHQTTFMFRKVPKLVVSFRIITMGEHFSKEIARFYNVNRIIGKEKKNGSFSVGPRSDFVYEFLSIFPDYRPKRKDRFPMSWLKDTPVYGETRTVLKDSRQRNLPGQLQYSVIKRLTSNAR